MSKQPKPRKNKARILIGEFYYRFEDIFSGVEFAEQNGITLDDLQRALDCDWVRVAGCIAHIGAWPESLHGEVGKFQLARLRQTLGRALGG